MPQFDLRGIHCAKYNNNDGAITYTKPGSYTYTITETVEDANKEEE